MVDNEPEPTDGEHAMQSVEDRSIAEMLLAVTSEPVYAIDLAEGFVRVNDAFLELTGYDRATLLGRQPREIVHEADREKFEQSVKLLRQDAAGTERWVSRLISKYGTAIPVEWTVSTTADGLLVGRASDERQDAHQKRKLEVLNRALRHNIRNHMNVIIGKATTLQEVDDEGYQTAAEKIEEIGKTVVNISDKARRAQEHVDIPPDEECRIDVAEAVETVVTQFAITYPAATVDTDLPDSAPARAPPSFDVALSELLENAVEHHPGDGGEIRVNCRVDEQWVHVEVADECDPIPQQVRETLHRGTETPLHHNDGLGLWIVRWVVDAVDGELAFDRREDDAGNVVRLSFERVDSNGS
jgi:PAS domain S-box-containing protein